MIYNCFLSNGLQKYKNFLFPTVFGKNCDKKM